MQLVRTIRVLVVTTVALAAWVGPAHALSCAMPEDAHVALRGEAMAPRDLRDPSDWQPTLVVDGIVLVTHNVPVETRLNTGEVINSRTTGEPSALVWIAGTSWGGGGELAVPGPLVRIWWSKAWGPPLQLGRAVFEVTSTGNRWQVPICTQPIQVATRPRYVDQRSWLQRLGFGPTLGEVRALLHGRIVDACEAWDAPPSNAPPAERAAGLRDLAARVEAAREPSREYWPVALAGLLRREADSLAAPRQPGPPPRGGVDPDGIPAMLRARMVTQFDIDACA